MLVAALVVTVATVIPAGAAPVVKVPATIAADCSRDVTGDLNRWIAQAKAGSTLQLAHDACYRVDGSVTLREKVDLTLDGNGASFEARTVGAQDRRHVGIVGGSNITVRDLRVKGANPTPGPERGYNSTKAFQHGFALQGVRGVRLDGVRVESVFGDFVYVGPNGAQWSTDVTVTRSKLEGSGRQGIAIVAGKRVTIDRNVIRGAGQSLIDLEPNYESQGAVDVRITRNRTGSARHFWLANKGDGLNIRRIVVEKNRMLEPTPGLVFVYGPRSGYRGPMVFADNRFQTTGTVSDEGSRGAFFLGRVKDVVIRGNDVTLPAGRNMPAVENLGSVDVVVERNTFRNAGQEVIVTGAPRPAPTPTPTSTTRAG